jgi:hypothetical protein
VIFPAWFEFHRDKAMRRSPACGAVYAAMIGLDDIFIVARPIKAWVLAEALEMEKETVLLALDKLVEHGYLQEHERGANNVRRFTVRVKLPDVVSSRLNPPAFPAA